MLFVRPTRGHAGRYRVDEDLLIKNRELFGKLLMDLFYVVLLL